jgi:membrane associated rhomboid family serine protease
LVWLLTQLLNQVGAVVDADAAGVAYAAHVRGAFFGILTACAFEQHVERRAAVQWQRARGSALRP